ncbi:MAG: hypothetical protein HXY20_02130 [Acidobacteria bacterium]|nr:hypothetical protein [Acidobacteriota bacterium]
MNIAGTAAILRVVALLVCTPAGTAAVRQDPSTQQHAASIAQPLLDFWLGFHESETCLEIDAVFAFHEKGMEIWCVVESSGALDKLRQRVAPLRRHFRVDLYVTRPQKDPQEKGDRQPPPSLWNNRQLRSHVPETSDWTSAGMPDAAGETRVHADRDFLLKSRLQTFADQTLGLSRRARQYALDLGELYRVAVDPAAGKAASARARRILLAHAAALRRTLRRLEDNLEYALPPPSKAARRQSGKPERGTPVLAETVQAIARGTEEIHRRVYRFIYPSDHTVELGDLKEPDLLQSLAELQHTVSRVPKAR